MDAVYHAPRMRGRLVQVLSVVPLVLPFATTLLALQAAHAYLVTTGDLAEFEGATDLPLGLLTLGHHTRLLLMVAFLFCSASALAIGWVTLRLAWRGITYARCWADRGLCLSMLGVQIPRWGDIPLAFEWAETKEILVRKWSSRTSGVSALVSSARGRADIPEWCHVPDDAVKHMAAIAGLSSASADRRRVRYTRPTPR